MSAIIKYIQDWIYSILEKLGFIGKEATLVLLGLDNAGKTTLQFKLKTGKLQGFTPTERAKEETLQIGGVTIKAWDLGGHAAARHLWRRYATAADGIVFMVDAADRDRIAEAKTELHSLLSDANINASVAAAITASATAAAPTASAAAPPASGADSKSESGASGGGAELAAAAAAGGAATPIAILANKTDLKVCACVVCCVGLLCCCLCAIGMRF